jgi:hypothetical protein
MRLVHFACIYLTLVSPLALAQAPLAVTPQGDTSSSRVRAQFGLLPLAFALCREAYYGPTLNPMIR